MTLEVSTDYELLFTDRGVSRPLGSFRDRDMSALTWGRQTDTVTTATVTVTAGTANCRLLERLRTWGHEMHVIRGGEEVWCGPVTNIAQGSSTAVLTGSDMLAWLGRRILHAGYDNTSTPIDILTLAEQDIVNALTVDDPNLLPYLRVGPAAGIMTSAKVDPASSYALDDLVSLARLGVDVFALGRAIVLQPSAKPLGHIGLLRDGDFVTTSGNGVTIEERGSEAATSCTVPDATGIVQVGTTDPFYGLLEILDKPSETSIGQAASTALANFVIAAGYPAPVYVNVPQGAQISPHAGIDIDQLVPGVTVDVQTTTLCRNLSQRQRLTQMTVTVGAGTEAVTVSLSPSSPAYSI